MHLRRHLIFIGQSDVDAPNQNCPVVQAVVAEQRKPNVCYI